MFNAELVVDMGSSFTTIFQRGKGIVLKEPSAVIVTKVKSRAKLVAAGKEARKIALSRNGLKPSENLIFPIKEGAVMHQDAAALMVREYVSSVIGGLIKPRIEVLATISCGASMVERKNIETVFLKAGLKNVTLMESPLAIMPLTRHDNAFVVIMGAGMTEVALVGPSGIIAGASVSISGDNMNKAIIDYVSANYRLIISQQKAEELKRKIGTLFDRQLVTMEVAGKDLLDGETRSVEVTADDVKAALMPSVDTLADVIEAVSFMCPDSIANEIYYSGVYVAGGAAAMHGLAPVLSEKIKFGVNVLEDPSSAVASGAGMLYEDRDKLYSYLSIK